MRKRSKYRPKAICPNPLRWVINGMRPVADATDEVRTLRLKNHMALSRLQAGQATYANMDSVITALNLTEALARLTLGDEYSALIRTGQDALFAAAQRGASSGLFAATPTETQALRLAFEVHDAQLDLCTVGELENAVRIVQDEFRNKRMRVVSCQNMEATPDGAAQS